MKIKKAHKVLATICGVVIVLVIAGLVGASGCGGEDYTYTTTTWYPGAVTEGDASGGAMADEAASLAPEAAYREQAQNSQGASLTDLEAAAGQKVMKEAVLDLEVEKGDFRAQFDKAQQLAGLYGGYVLSSNSSVTGDEDKIQSGSVSIRVPVDKFDKMMAEAKKLGEVKYENTLTQDVTEEYTDLQSRITNQQAYVNSILALLGKAKTISEILQVQQTLAYAQQELEQLKGRMQYLEGHTSYSTLTMNIYETGARVSEPEGWGFVQALKDAVHNIVKVFNGVARGLGWIIPVVIILGIVAGIAYLVVKSARKRTRQRAEESDEKAS